MTNTREQQFIARIAELETENQALRARVTELEQQVSKPLATPTSPPKSPVPGFVKPKRQKRRRKKPGQKPGHAGSYRHRPTEADEIIETPLEDCPHCHGLIENVTTHEQYVEEIIPAQTIVVCYRTQSGYCQNCQKQVRSRHPQQVPHRLIGTRAMLIAGELKHANAKVPYRKVATVLKRLCGLSITAGALTQSMQSLAEWFTPEYQAIQAELRRNNCTYVDETGWRLDGHRIPSLI
jgi:transposase